MKQNSIAKLASLAGHYIGRGVNHEGLAFTGSFALEPILNGRGIAVAFKATGDDGTVFHEESTTIAPMVDGRIGLLNLNTNMPSLIPHTLTRTEMSGQAAEALVFSFGDREDKSSFREEITIELHSDHRIGYKYAWGLPKGEFADRSAVVMTRQ